MNEVRSPGQVFEQTWRVRNSGRMPWEGRKLERQGPLTGPGLITSLRFLDIPTTKAGGGGNHGATQGPDLRLFVHRLLQDGGRGGKPCFPDSYQLGLDVLVLVRGQAPDSREWRREPIPAEG
jgi:hypothetical protein